MDNKLQGFIFLFLIGTTLLNFGIAVLSRLKTGHKEFNVLILYWVALLFTYGAVAALSQTPQQIAFAYFFQMISTYIMTSFLNKVRGIRVNVKFLLGQYIGFALLSAYLILWTDVGFTLSVLPVCTAVAIPYLQPIYNVLIKNWKTSHWVEKALAYVFITCIFNSYTYAFFRLDPSAAWWGWSVSIAQYQSLSIFLFLLVNNRREQNEKRKLQFALDLMTGKNSSYNMEVEDLYRRLEEEISQKETYLNDLTRANQNLEEEQKTNELLIQTISHDIASPLTVISAYVSMFISGKVAPADHQKILLRIKENLDSGSEMINRIRQAIVSRSQANYIKLAPVNLERVMERLLTLFDSRLKAKNLQIDYKITRSSLEALADENALVEHVLSNILSNAIKFSYEGEKISIEVRETETDVVEILIRDSGPGISQERLERKVLRSTIGTAGEPGTGFGILIMEYFLRQFGATYSISSSTVGDDRGTIFSLKLKKTFSTPQLHIRNASESQNAHFLN